MSSKIDWLSFTLPVLLEAPNDEAYALSIERAFYDHCGKELTDAVFAGKWELQEKGRQPYKHVWTRKDAPIAMFTHPDLRHMAIEFSGQGCDWLREKGLFDELVRCVSDRVTRLDVATDIETTINPSAFVGAGRSARFKALGHYTSDSGETIYVGSQKSEKFARVYRYAAPHPRAHLLRVEHVLRRDVAKAYARELSHTNVETLAATLGKSFEWAHEAWSLRDMATVEIDLVRGARTSSGTIRWLITSVAPAFKRMVREGEIENPEQFIMAYFLDGILSETT